MDEIANRAIDLYFLLKKWEESHSSYSHHMTVEEGKLCLTLIKND